MPGVTTGILCNALPLSAEHVKSVEKEVLEKQETFAYIDENSELCFSLPSNPDVIKDIAWNNAYELYNVEGTLTKNAYRKTGLETFTLDKTFIKNSVEDSWSDSTTSNEKLEGDGQEFYTTAPSTLSFRSTAPLDEFQDVQINGQTVDPSNYILEEGSTIVKLKHDYLSTLDTGKYEVAIISDSKTVKGDFTIAAPELNEYGFYYNQPYFINSDEFLPWSFKSAVIFDKDNTVRIYQIDSSNQYTGAYSYENGTISFILANDQSMTGEDPFSGSFSVDGKILSGILEFSALGCEHTEVSLKLTENVVCDDAYIYYKSSLSVGYTDRSGFEYFPLNRTLANYSAAKDNILGLPVDIIPYEAFMCFENLKNVEIPASIAVIDSYAFYGCAKLTSIIIPASLTHLGTYAIGNCTALTDISFRGTIDQWNAITKMSDWNYNVPATYVQCSDGQVAL